MQAKCFWIRRFLSWLCWAYAFQHLFTPVLLPRTLGTEIPLLPAVRVVNRALDPFKSLIPVDAASIEILARNLGEGLEQYKPEQLLDEESFNRSLEGAQANMSFFGRILIRHGASTMLAMQWRVAQLIDQHPEILLEEVGRPLFLTGFARSGSTFLFQVMADAGLGFRHVKFWESIGGPVPLQDLDPDHSGTYFDIRIQKAAAVLAVFKWLMPSISVLHEWNSLYDPEEEVAWLGATYIDTTASITSEDVGMQQRGMQADASLKYKLLKRILQCMQYEERLSGVERPRRWILKSPEHAIGVDALLSEFPDAKLVAIHRDPARSLQSLLVLKHHLSGLFINSPNPASSLAWTALYMCRGLEGFKLLRSLSNDTITMLDFSDVVGSTMQTVKKVVKFSGMEWNASVEQRVALAVRRRREVQRIRFEYNMTQFGLDHSSILALLESCDGILDEAKSVKPRKQGAASRQTQTQESNKSVGRCSTPPPVQAAAVQLARAPKCEIEKNLDSWVQF